MTNIEIKRGTATKPTPPASTAIAAVGVRTNGVAAAAAIMPAVLGMDSILVPKAFKGEDGILNPLHATTTNAINTVKNCVRLIFTVVDRLRAF